MVDRTEGVPMSDKPKLNEMVKNFFPEAQAAVDKGNCPTCGKPVGEFKDRLSEKEYQISGMCQKCQDSFFG